VDSVCATVRELEAAGYIIRRRVRDKNGQMRGMEYTVLEEPQPPQPEPEQAEPSCAKPEQVKPKREKPVQANPAQLNTKEQKKEITKNVSNPIRTADEREQYRDLIRENIEYDILAKNNPADRIRLDELVELMLDTVCSKRSSIRIAGDEFPTEVVKSRFLKLEAQHIQYVLDSLKDGGQHQPQQTGDELHRRLVVAAKLRLPDGHQHRNADCRARRTEQQIDHIDPAQIPADERIHGQAPFLIDAFIIAHFDEFCQVTD
jgi:hypothetical protein